MTHEHDDEEVEDAIDSSRYDHDQVAIGTLARSSPIPIVMDRLTGIHDQLSVAPFLFSETELTIERCSSVAIRRSSRARRRWRCIEEASAAGRERCVDRMQDWEYAMDQPIFIHISRFVQKAGGQTHMASLTKAVAEKYPMM